MAYKTPKPGTETHSVKVDLPLDLVAKIDAFGKNAGIVTRSAALIEFVRHATVVAFTLNASATTTV